MGESTTAERATALIKELNPKCIAMCGICAGNKKDVALGDVIVADYVYSYDEGKYVAAREGEDPQEAQFLQDLKTYNLEATWRVDATYFARELDWTAKLVKTRPVSLETQTQWLLRALLAHEQEGAVAPHEHPERDTACENFPDLWLRLRRPEHGLLVETPGELRLTDKGRRQATERKMMYPKELPKDRDFKVHVGPIATGKAVQKDPGLFERLEKSVRKTLGAEVERASRR